MKKCNLLSLLLLFAVAIIINSCESNEPTQEVITLSQSEFTFQAQASTETVEVASNTAWSAAIFRAGEDQSWITVSPQSGSNNQTLTISVAENNSEARSAVVRVFSQNAMAELTISQEAGVEPEVPTPPTPPETEVKELSYVRALYSGTAVTITEDIAVEGIVISDFRRNTSGGLNNYTSARAIVIADATAGIQLFCTEENGEFARGDKVKVLLKDQQLSVYNNGALQVNNLPLANISKIAEGQAVTPKEITAAELLTGAYESMYVTVKDVQVVTADLAKTFVMGDSHTSITIEAATGESFDIFTSKYATFGSQAVPQGFGPLSGIAGVNNGRYQIIISSTSDFASMTGARFGTEPFFNIEGTGLSVSGDAGSIKIVLATNVEWSAQSSNGEFTLSQTSGTEGATITVTYTDNNSTTDSRVATITFTTTNEAITNKTITYTITQSPYEVLVEDAPQAWMELPKVTTGQQDYAYIAHRAFISGADVRNYSMWYDTKNKLALWVAYPLYNGMIGTSGRTDEWEYDPKIPKRYQAELYRSYGVSGYDRGHQLPSADRTASTVLNETTFYFSNMTPQNSSLNQNIWASLESKVRGWLSGSDTLYVVTGAVLPQSGEIEYLQDNKGEKVAVPKAYYKVILRYSAASEQNGGYSAIGFWFENRAYEQNSVTANDAKSVDEIETLTGFDFFSNLNETVEQAVEVGYDASSWGL